MNARRRSPIAPYLDPVTDLGPSLRRGTDGRMHAWGGAASVMVEDRPDPDAARKTPVRGARRRDALRDLYNADTITKRHYDACMRFLDDCSLASGGGLVANWLASPSGNGPRAGLPETQVSAITRVREAFHILGLNNGVVFWRVVLDDWSLNQCDATDRVRKGTSIRLLREAMHALDEHYHRGARR